MQQNPSIKRRNILFLDMLRGLAVLNMAAYHLLYDLVYIFGIPISWFSIYQCFVWEQFICFTFILIAGMSFRLSKNPWKNGWKLLGCGAVLTAVTMLVIPEEVIWFGILHLLGSSILLTRLCWPLLQRIPAMAGFGLSFVLFAVTRHIPQRRIGISHLWEGNLPDVLYETPFLFWAGFPSDVFFSSDYFPVIPWMMLFLMGCFGGIWWMKGSEWLTKQTGLPENKAYRILDRSLGRVGRKSLWIYMLHQPVFYGTLLFLQKMDWL